MDITPQDIYGFTVYGSTFSSTVTGASATLVNNVSGFTLATPFTCSLNYATSATESAITSLYDIVWWFGDGTYSKEFSPSHIYNWPGQYEIKVALYSSLSASVPTLSGRTFSTVIKVVDYLSTLSATNYLSDNLSWNYGVSSYYNKSWNDIMVGSVSAGACFFGYQSCKSGVISSGPVPLTVNYYTTNIKDNESIKFTFYSENSLSQPYTEVPPSQLANLRPRWRFTTVSASPLDDGFVMNEYIPLSSTEVRILSSGARSDTGTVVGLSGSFQFYYIDDMPSMVYNSASALVSANPTTIWVNLNTNNIINPQEYSYNNVFSYSNTLVSLSSFYYVQSLTADHIGVNLNGKVPFYETYWPRVESRFATTVNSAYNLNTAGEFIIGDSYTVATIGNTNFISIGASANNVGTTFVATGAGTGNGTAYVIGGTAAAEFISNKVLLNFPITTANNYLAELVSSLSSVAVSATFNISTVPAIYNALTYTIYRYDALNRNTGGYYTGTFTPYTTGAFVLSARSQDVVPSVNDMIPLSSTGYNPIFLSAQSSILNSKIIQGTSNEFNVVNFENTYFARKFNQGFDYGAQLKKYALQPTINQNEEFFDTYLPAIAGVSATSEDTFGGVVYEKIANFVSNTSDPSKANITQFYSLAQSLGIELDNFDYDTPATLSRIVDLYSTQQSTVWGARSLFARNFAAATGHINLGSELSAYNINTTVVTAGQKIVVNDIFNPQNYELLEVPAINSYSSITARNLPFTNWGSPVSALTYPLNIYPLSAFFGCGLTTPVINNYRFFVYNNVVDNQQVEGLVNWDDPYTTLSENASGHNDWVKDEGILENIFNYYIHKGLGLIK